jgi:hypothetical protein
MYDKELHNLYPSNNIRAITIKVDKIGNHVARMEEMRYSYKCVVRKPGCKRPFRGLKPRWQGNMKIYIEEMACGGLDLFGPG